MEPYIQLLNDLETSLNKESAISVKGFDNQKAFFEQLELCEQALIERIQSTPIVAKKFTDFYEKYKLRYTERKIRGQNNTEKLHRSFKFEDSIGAQNLPTLKEFYSKVTLCNREIDSYAKEALADKNEFQLSQEACIKLNMNQHQFFDLIMQLSQMKKDGYPVLEILNANQAGHYFSLFFTQSKGEFLNPGTLKGYLTETEDKFRKFPKQRLFIVDEEDYYRLEKLKKSK